jgi:hypothetical protein
MSATSSASSNAEGGVRGLCVRVCVPSPLTSVCVVQLRVKLLHDDFCVVRVSAL